MQEDIKQIKILLKKIMNLLEELNDKRILRKKIL